VVNTLFDPIFINNELGVEISPLGETAVIVQFGSRIDQLTHHKVQALSSYLNRNPFPGLIEIVPAFVTVAVFYEPMKLSDPLTGDNWRHGTSGIRSPFELICRIVDRILSNLDHEAVVSPRTISIPVCYGGEWGPDLDEVARHNGLTAAEVIDIHAAGVYTVYMIGFAPGFPYLGGMSERIVTPRRSAPRLTIEAGTIGIGGQQTGIYPIPTPGGWQLIGRTPLSLFRPNHENPSFLQAGDQVRFQPIGLDQYLEWKEERA
jgi:inhibitor of KinA